MSNTDQCGKKKRLTCIASEKGIEKAESAVIKLKFNTKNDFTKVKLLARSTVTKFFDRKPIQLDSFKKICEELKLNWEEIIELPQNEIVPYVPRESQVAFTHNLETEQGYMQITSRLILVIDRENKEVIVEMTLEGDINSVQSDLSFWQSDFSRKYPNGNIKVIAIKPGSIKIVIEGNQEDIDVLLSDFESGELTEINGYPVQNIQILTESVEDDESSEQKWRLVEDIRTNQVEGRDLRGVDLSDADLSGAYLVNANLIDGDLSDCDLIVANLRGANLRGANLRGANLRGANLRGANLRGADLRGADLSNTVLNRLFFLSNLSDAVLSGVFLIVPIVIIVGCLTLVFLNPLLILPLLINLIIKSILILKTKWGKAGKPPKSGNVET